MRKLIPLFAVALLIAGAAILLAIHAPPTLIVRTVETTNTNTAPAIAHPPPGTQSFSKVTTTKTMANTSQVQVPMATAATSIEAAETGTNGRLSLIAALVTTAFSGEPISGTVNLLGNEPDGVTDTTVATLNRKHEVCAREPNGVLRDTERIGGNWMVSARLLEPAALGPPRASLA